VPGRPSAASALDIVLLAVNTGARLLDTADIYGLDDEFGYTETLLAEVVKALPEPDRPIITTKGGLIRRPDGTRLPDGRPEYLRTACKNSLRRLGLEAIDIYQLHRPDPAVPFAASVGALKELVDDGTVRAVGVSNVTEEQLDTAAKILGEDLVSVQNKFSIEDQGDTAVISRCAGNGLTYLAWGPLGGVGRGAGLAERVSALTTVAARHGVSPQRVALAWILATHPDVAPVVGASSRNHVLDSFAATTLSLSAEDHTVLAGG
jgi:aryl-alcohol dehydrogenase-like predicted oxidoreductase